LNIIDRYAYQNRIRRMDPAYKAGLAFTTLLLCLLLDKPWVGLTAVVWMCLLAVWLAGLKWQVFCRVLLIEAGFLVMATIGVVLTMTMARPGELMPWVLPIGPFWLSSSPAALTRGVGLVTRALGAASAMNFLSLTTPLVDMLELSRRWHAPAILVDLTVIIYRFIFVLLDSLNTMLMAQDSRLGYTTSYRRAMNSAGLLGSRLFVETLQRSRRLQIALDSRGYEGGDLLVLPTPYQSDHRLVWLGLLLSVSLVIVWWMV
jgi:cobalt/nickel transport system permease protein